MGRVGLYGSTAAAAAPAAAAAAAAAAGPWGLSGDRVERRQLAREGGKGGWFGERRTTNWRKKKTERKREWTDRSGPFFFRRREKKNVENKRRGRGEGGGRGGEGRREWEGEGREGGRAMCEKCGKEAGRLAATCECTAINDNKTTIIITVKWQRTII